MTQKPKFFAPHWNMTPEQRQAKIDERLKKENEAAIKHKQLTSIYIDRIDDAFRHAKFKDAADVAAFHCEHRPCARDICLDFVSFHKGILNACEADDEARLVLRFIDRYFQERVDLKYEYVRSL